MIWCFIHTCYKLLTELYYLGFGVCLNQSSESSYKQTGQINKKILATQILTLSTVLFVSPFSIFFWHLHDHHIDCLCLGSCCSICLRISKVNVRFWNLDVWGGAKCEEGFKAVTQRLTGVCCDQSQRFELKWDCFFIQMPQRNRWQLESRAPQR